VPEAADAPSPGKDFWNTIGNYVAGILNKVTPADVAAFLKALISSTLTASTDRQLRRFAAEYSPEMEMVQGCASQRFVNVTAERYNCLIRKAAASGIAIEGYEGQLSRDGITVRWKFDPVSHLLDIECLAAPFFLSCGTINGKIHDFVDSCFELRSLTPSSEMKLRDPR
jgi:hypothetical protein